jgi:serine/threonine protein kinase
MVRKDIKLKSGIIVNNTFELISKLGEGAYGTIWDIRWIDSSITDPVAAKIIRVDENQSDIDNEIKCWKLVNDHPGIVKLKQVMTHKLSTYTYTYIIQEKVQGINMADLIERITGMSLETVRAVKCDSVALSERSASRYFAQIITALIHMHSQGVAHGDIKAENIMIDTRTDSIKLVDFGFSTTEHLSTDHCGTIDYAAPEIVSGTSYVKFLTDIWACGVLLYEMLTGITPFASMDAIKEIKYQIPSSVSSPAKELLRKILVKDPSQRLSLEGILDHEFVKLYR